jgi:N-methylhydantoinase A
MHAVALAREFGITRVVVPKFSSVFSALGCLTAELSYTEQHAVRISSTAWQADEFEDIRQQMYARLARPLTAAGHALDSLQARHVALIRYAGQSGTVEVAFTPPADHNALDAEFKAQHQRLYGFVTDEPWELETLRLTVSAATGNDINVPVATAAPATMVAPETQCWFDRDRSVTTPRYPRETLAAKQKIEGPAIIEDQWSTTVVPPGATAWSDLSGHIHIDTGGAA